MRKSTLRRGEKWRFSQHLWPRSHRTIWYNQERISDEICDNVLHLRTLSDFVQISDFCTFGCKGLFGRVETSVMSIYITLHSSPSTSLATSSSGPPSPPPCTCTPRPLFPSCIPAARVAISRAESCASIERYQISRVSKMRRNQGKSTGSDPQQRAIITPEDEQMSATRECSVPYSSSSGNMLTLPSRPNSSCKRWRWGSWEDQFVRMWCFVLLM